MIPELSRGSGGAGGIAEAGGIRPALNAAGGVPSFGDGGLEELVLRDAALQRRLAFLQRRLAVRERREMTAVQVERMLAAARCRLFSALVASVAEVGAGLHGMRIESLGARATGAQRLLATVLAAAAAGIGKFQPLDLEAARHEAGVRRAEGGGAEAAEGVKAADGWLESVRELERALVQRLDGLAAIEHATQEQLRNLR
jgi:hypothetical protein